MELQQLRYFVTVAELGNFTRAAEKCLVSQPSLSQQIIKLEKEIGHPLIERLGRSLRLTSAGEVFYERASNILCAVEETQHLVNASYTLENKKIRLGAIPTIAPFLIPPLLKKLFQTYPDAEITFREMTTDQTMQDCKAGDLDLAFLSLPLEDDLLHVEPLFSEELFLAVYPDHKLLKKKKVTSKDLEDESFILLSEAHCLGQQIVSFCQHHHYLPRVSCESAQLATVQELVGLGLGISLIPEMAKNIDKSKKVKYLSLSGIKPTRTIVLVTHPQRYQSNLVKAFIANIKEWCPLNK
ncbi:MAG: LysR family transcriptional regulator [Planctomycetes bacterium]|nr:LysR family transcriptional regulator [Planctomycetota bacterium]MCH9727834.1 LysR family transcriptional regulator [Planctomycetota bacterium]MCH9776901.1 LysR family transcriptional regulator [Planctomycetota bacterium]